MADLSQTENNVALNLTEAQRQKMIVGQLGEAVTTGSPLYLDTSVSPNVWKNALASGTQLQATVQGFASAHGVTGQWIGILRPTDDSFDVISVNLGAGVLTKGTEYFLSKNAGKISPRADLVSTNWITSLGTIADAVSNFNWRPIPPTIQVP